MGPRRSWRARRRAAPHLWEVDAQVVNVGHHKGHARHEQRARQDARGHEQAQRLAHAHLLGQVLREFERGLERAHDDEFAQRERLAAQLGEAQERLAHVALAQQLLLRGGENGWEEGEMGCGGSY